MEAKAKKELDSDQPLIRWTDLYMRQFPGKDIDVLALIRMHSREFRERVRFRSDENNILDLMKRIKTNPNDLTVARDLETIGAALEFKISDGNLSYRSSPEDEDSTIENDNDLRMVLESNSQWDHMLQQLEADKWIPNREIFWKFFTSNISQVDKRTIQYVEDLAKAQSGRVRSSELLEPAIREYQRLPDKEKTLLHHFFVHLRENLVEKGIREKGGSYYYSPVEPIIAQLKDFETPNALKSRTAEQQITHRIPLSTYPVAHQYLNQPDEEKAQNLVRTYFHPSVRRIAEFKHPRKLLPFVLAVTRTDDVASDSILSTGSGITLLHEYVEELPEHIRKWFHISPRDVVSEDELRKKIPEAKEPEKFEYQAIEDSQGLWAIALLPLEDFADEEKAEQFVQALLEGTDGQWKNHRPYTEEVLRGLKRLANEKRFNVLLKKLEEVALPETLRNVPTEKWFAELSRLDEPSIKPVVRLEKGRLRGDPEKIHTPEQEAIAMREIAAILSIHNNNADLLAKEPPPTTKASPVFGTNVLIQFYDGWSDPFESEYHLPIRHYGEEKNLQGIVNTTLTLIAEESAGIFSISPEILQKLRDENREKITAIWKEIFAKSRSDTDLREKFSLKISRGVDRIRLTFRYSDQIWNETIYFPFSLNPQRAATNFLLESSNSVCALPQQEPLPENVTRQLIDLLREMARSGLPRDHRIGYQRYVEDLFDETWLQNKMKVRLAIDFYLTLIAKDRRDAIRDMLNQAFPELWN